MDFNVIDFLCDPSEKGLHSTKVSIQGGKRTEVRALRSILGCLEGIDKPPGDRGPMGFEQERRNAEGSRVAEQGRLQVAPREGVVHLGSVAIKAGVKYPCWTFTISATGGQA